MTHFAAGADVRFEHGHRGAALFAFVNEVERVCRDLAWPSRHGHRESFSRKLPPAYAAVVSEAAYSSGAKGPELRSEPLPLNHGAISHSARCFEAVLLVAGDHRRGRPEQVS